MAQKSPSSRSLFSHVLQVKLIKYGLHTDSCWRRETLKRIMHRSTDGGNRALIQPLKCNSNLLSWETASLGSQTRPLISTRIISHHKCMPGQPSNAFISQVREDIISNSHLSSLPRTQRLETGKAKAYFRLFSEFFFFTYRVHGLHFMLGLSSFEWLHKHTRTNTWAEADDWEVIARARQEELCFISTDHTLICANCTHFTPRLFWKAHSCGAQHTVTVITMLW